MVRSLRLATGVSALLAIIAIGVFHSSLARAAVIHEFAPGPSAAITAGVPVGSGAPVTGALGGIGGLTVDGGLVWLDDQPQGSSGARFDAFDAGTGEWQDQLEAVTTFKGPFSGVAVGHAAGEREVYIGATERVVEEGGGVVGVFGASGALQGIWRGGDTPDGSFGKSGGGRVANVTGVVVDESSGLTDWAAGDVYVSTASNISGVVDVFRPGAGGSEEYVTQLTGAEGVHFSEPLGVAVDDSNGDVLVLDSREHPVVDVFEPVAGMNGAYRFVFKISGTPSGPFAADEATIAVDGAAGDVYVSAVAEVEPVVDQFRLGVGGESASYVGHVAGTPGGPFARVLGVAADPVSHRLYVADLSPVNGHGLVDVFGPNLVVPDVVSSPASGLGVGKATSNGSVNPVGEGPATCRFVYGTGPSELTKTAECEGPGSKATPVPGGTSNVSVHAELEGLAPDTTYFYRLQATNKNGENGGERSQDQTFTSSGPGLHGESAADVAATSATLNATVDPHSTPTSCFFEYGTSTVYGSDVPEAPGPAIGSGEGDVTVQPEHLQGLSTATVYHYRLVVLSELSHGETVRFNGPDRTFETQGLAAGELPDDRQWEMVSPPSKRGAVIEPIGQEGLIQAAADGSAFTYHANTPVEAAPAGYADEVQAISSRGASGWISENIALPHMGATGKSEGVGEDYRFFSEDLGVAIAQPAGAFIPAGSPQALAPEEASEQTAFLRADFSGAAPCTVSCYRPLVTGKPGHANVPPGTVFGEEGRCPALAASCGPEFQGASADGSHIVLASRTALTSTPAPSGGLFEWNVGVLSLLSLLPASEGGLADTGGPVLGAALDFRHAISQDGTRVVWSETVGGHHLFVRDTELGQTVRLDAVQGGSGEGFANPGFQAASADGSRVFFTDDQQLTSGASTEAGTSDLYECELVVLAGELQCSLSDLTQTNGGEAAEVQGGVLGVSEDGSYVYFVADGELAPGAIHGDCSQGTSTPEDLCNLYVRHEGTTKLVAVISGAEKTDWGIESPESLPGMTARVSPNGRWLAFMSDRELTGYDTHDAASGKLDEEVYQYDATAAQDTGRLLCASCDPTGARPKGILFGAEGRNMPLVSAKGGWGPAASLSADLPGWTAYRLSRALYQSRYLSDSGRLFFDSRDALAPNDVNGTWDVYEYEPSGIGDCTAASATFVGDEGGCVGLISTGSSAEESAFLDASETGGDVFFLTASKLSTQDFDTSVDIYDAHECSAGSPCLNTPPVSSPPCTTAEACRAAPRPQPEIFGAPPSATFNGLGNFTPPPPTAKPKPKSLTGAQKLAKALRACHPLRAKRRRAACERAARRRYGLSAKAKMLPRPARAKR